MNKSDQSSKKNFHDETAAFDGDTSNLNVSDGDILIKNGRIITVDPQNRIIDNGAVLIKSDIIIKIGSTAEMAGLNAACVIDAKSGIVMPGLVNTHTHLPMSLFRGFADDIPLITWLNDYIFKLEEKYIQPETVQCGTLLSCAEMLLSGTTTCCDGYFHEESVAEAVKKSGMRAVLGQGVIDFPAPGVVEPSLNVENAANYARRFKNRYPKITSSIFCHSPYTCSKETLISAKQAARDIGVLFQIHVAETKAEQEQMRQQYQTTAVKYLDDCGILDQNTLLVHTVWVTDEDIEIIRQRGSSISHNPESNMKLGSGIAPVLDFIRAGIPTGLGTDGSASNNNLDLFTEMDLAAKLHKIHRYDVGVLDVLSVVRMATIEGAKAIGLGDITGSIEIGKKADLIILDTHKPHLVPMYNPISHLVYSATGADVKDVIIDGKIVLNERKITTLDLDSILIKATEFAGHLIM
ncbi:MAG: amidohydrolase [Desulfamplus sp.]|nr:amidohydrolase [Desulfamplus sp.]